MVCTLLCEANEREMCVLDLTLKFKADKPPGSVALGLSHS